MVSRFPDGEQKREAGRVWWPPVHSSSPWEVDKRRQELPSPQPQAAGPWDCTLRTSFWERAGRRGLMWWVNVASFLWGTSQMPLLKVQAGETGFERGVPWLRWKQASPAHCNGGTRRCTSLQASTSLGIALATHTNLGAEPSYLQSQPSTPKDNTVSYCRAATQHWGPMVGSSH